MRVWLLSETGSPVSRPSAGLKKGHFQTSAISTATTHFGFTRPESGTFPGWPGLNMSWFYCDSPLDSRTASWVILLLWPRRLYQLLRTTIFRTAPSSETETLWVIIHLSWSPWRVKMRQVRSSPDLHICNQRFWDAGLPVLEDAEISVSSIHQTHSLDTTSWWEQKRVMDAS